MPRPRTRRAFLAAFAVVLLAGALASSAGIALGDARGHDAKSLSKINHIVVIYEENHSFDNLYGDWEGANGRSNADATHTLQIGQTTGAYHCLLQNDVNLTAPDPLSPDCTDTTTATAFVSHFFNAPFSIEQYIP